jgi:hypothetical protein
MIRYDFVGNQCIRKGFHALKIFDSRFSNAGETWRNSMHLSAAEGGVHVSHQEEHLIAHLQNKTSLMKE